MGNKGKSFEFNLVFGMHICWTGHYTDLCFEGQKRIAWGDVGIWLFHGQVALRNDFLESIYIALSAHHCCNYSYAMS